MFPIASESLYQLHQLKQVPAWSSYQILKLVVSCSFPLVMTVTLSYVFLVFSSDSWMVGFVRSWAMSWINFTTQEFVCNTISRSSADFLLFLKIWQLYSSTGCIWSSNSATLFLSETDYSQLCFPICYFGVNILCFGSFLHWANRCGDIVKGAFQASAALFISNWNAGHGMFLHFFKNVIRGSFKLSELLSTTIQ